MAALRADAQYQNDEYETARREADARLYARPSRVRAMSEAEWRQFTGTAEVEVSGAQRARRSR